MSGQISGGPAPPHVNKDKRFCPEEQLRQQRRPGLEPTHPTTALPRTPPGQTQGGPPPTGLAPFQQTPRLRRRGPTPTSRPNADTAASRTRRPGAARSPGGKWHGRGCTSVCRERARRTLSGEEGPRGKEEEGEEDHGGPWSKSGRRHGHLAKRHRGGSRAPGTPQHSLHLAPSPAAPPKPGDHLQGQDHPDPRLCLWPRKSSSDPPHAPPPTDSGQGELPRQDTRPLSALFLGVSRPTVRRGQQPEVRAARPWATTPGGTGLRPEAPSAPHRRPAAGRGRPPRPAAFPRDYGLPGTARPVAPQRRAAGHRGRAAGVRLPRSAAQPPTRESELRAEFPSLTASSQPEGPPEPPPTPSPEPGPARCLLWPGPAMEPKPLALSPPVRQSPG
ncbi:proline-rich protein 2-like [Artibeus jamaicensis]|uniref:proline-rich protein 2-like n=1 Tax=Artibeus jamaicensis TaxID=9417 RepID=UPI00235AC321|nr:proline-rich protein 2-like [Artibeus jamaicensis]